MAIQHKDIPDADLHEPKGVVTAALGAVYIADGAGSGDWIVPMPRGSVTFSNIAAPLTVTYPAAYTKVSPTTTVSGFSREVTEATSARLTYLGTETKPVRIEANMCFQQAIGANRDIRFAIYKNGAVLAQSEGIISTITATKAEIKTFVDVLAVTNDYFELYVRNEGASGDLTVYMLQLSLTGLGIQ